MVRRKLKTVVCCQEQLMQQYAGVLYHLYDEIIEIDIIRDDAYVILYTEGKPGMLPDRKEIDSFFRSMAEWLVAKEDRDGFLQICNRRYLSSCLEKQAVTCLEYREYTDGEKMGWVQAEIIPVDSGRMLFAVKEIYATDYKLFKSMVDRLIFKQNEQYPELDDDEKDLLLENAVQEAKTDSLTLLYNQKAMKLLVNHRLECHHQGAVIFIDLDNFKMVNDRYGHTTGDEVLKRVAEGFCDCVGQDDMAGRIGGDEFVLFLSGDRYENRREMEEAVSRICRDIRKSMGMAAVPERLTCSMGAAFYPYDGTDYGVLVDKADQALYRAKREGKDRCVFYGE